MPQQLFCPDCDYPITKLEDGWGCEECGYYREFIQQPANTPAEGSYPIAKEQDDV